MKPNKIVLLFIPFLVLMSSCSINTTSGQKKEDLNEYNFVRDFSNQHGYRGWRYLYGDIEEPSNMTYDIDECYWRGLDFYCYIRIDEQHPGNNKETIIGWDVQKNGKISVNGSILRCPVEWKGDGIFFYAVYVHDKKPEEEYLAYEIVPALKTDITTYSFEKDVKEGDSIYFVLNGNKDNSYDSTKNDIVINYI